MILSRTAITYGLILLAIAAVWTILARPRSVAAPELAAGEKLQCVSYTPFRAGESPYDLDRGLRISPASIESDLALLAERFGCIRTYSVTGLEAIPALAEKFGLKVLLGAWVSADQIATQKELLSVIALARAHPSTIRAIVVGNEALLRKEVTGAQLAGYLRQVKQALPDVPVTYADVWEFWLKHPQVAPAADFVTIHILPYWEDEPTAIDDALAHVREVHDAIARKIPGKDILIGETGWPSSGRMRRGALPSIDNQARFIRGFVDMAKQEHWQYNLIEAFDQPWKRVNEGTVGGAWGIYDTHRHDKGVLRGPVRPHPDAWVFGLVTAILSLATAPLLSRHRPLNSRKLGVFGATVTVGATALGLQLEQFSVTCVNAADHAAAVSIVLLSGACYFLTAHALARGRRDAPAPVSHVFLPGHRNAGNTLSVVHDLVYVGLVLCLIGKTLGLVFDPRYRDFDVFAFVLPAIAYALVFTHRRTWPPAAIDRGLAAVLITAAGFILYQETPANGYATVWALLCILFAYPLWRSSAGARIPRARRVVLAAVTAYALAAGLRYGVMESPQLVERCAADSSDLLCAVRSGTGLIIHFRLIGWLAVLGSALALATAGRRFRTAAPILFASGVVLYNANLAIIACLLWILAVARAGPQSPPHAEPVAA